MKAPAFLFYTGDFLSSPDVQLMEAHEVGAYCLLLFNSWQSDRPGYLPNDEDRLRRTARLTAEQWAGSRQLLLSKFPPAPDEPMLRHNPRLAAEAGKQQAHRELKARAGKASAAKRAAFATGVEKKPTPVQHLLPENGPVLPATEPLSTGVDQIAAPVAPPPNTCSEKGQQKGNLSLSISKDSSLRSESRAALPALAPANPSKARKSKATQQTAPPTLAEVQAYAAEQHPNSVDAQAEAAAFCDHYESNGWRVGGKTPMVSWQAAFRGWMRRRGTFQGSPAPPATPGRARTAPKPADPSRWS